MENVTLGLMSFIFVGAISLHSPPVYASKIDVIQRALKEECQTKVNSKKALTLIRPLYLTCVPGTKVSLEMCDVSCLKGSANIVVGRQETKKEDSL